MTEFPVAHPQAHLARDPQACPAWIGNPWPGD